MAHGGARRPELPALELHWSAERPLRQCHIRLPGAAARLQPPLQPAFDFTAAMARLCEDIIQRCPLFGHIRMSEVLVTVTPGRSRSRYGLQARVTPLRFRDGALRRRHGDIEYQVQRFFVNGREILYLLTFCLPRFLEQPFREKLTTVFHELYHISPAFNGDLRRHAGRYCLHTHSKAHYDAHMQQLAQQYLRGHDQPAVLEFLRWDCRRLLERYSGLVGTVVPRPKLLPIGRFGVRMAAQLRRPDLKSEPNDSPDAEPR